MHQIFKSIYDKTKNNGNDCAAGLILACVIAG